MLTAWNMLAVAFKVVFVLIRLALVKLTFTTWVAALWLYAHSPVLQALVTSSPSVVLLVATMSAAIGIRWLCWLTRCTSATLWISEPAKAR
jgi:hypothetical protein